MQGVAFFHDCGAGHDVAQALTVAGAVHEEQPYPAHAQGNVYDAQDPAVEVVGEFGLLAIGLHHAQTQDHFAHAAALEKILHDQVVEGADEKDDP